MEKRKKYDKVDRLSSLPDCLIHHILSSVDAKYAVQTCVLSKRWTHLWPYLPTLNLSDVNFAGSNNFRTFVERVLDNCMNSTLLAVRFSYQRLPDFNGIVIPLRPDIRLVERIAYFAVSHRVEELIMHLEPRQCGRLPHCLFSNQCLKVLKLEGIRNMRGFPNSLALTSLRTLHLVDVDLSKYGNSHCFDLFSRCLNLENMVLSRVCISVSNVFNISAPKLVVLEMSDLKFRRRIQNGIQIISWRDESWKVVIAAPSLTTFKYSDEKPLLLSMENSPLLDKVDICLCSYPVKQAADDPGRKEFLLALNNMLLELGNARSLKLSNSTRQA